MARVPYVTQHTAPPKVAEMMAKMAASGQQPLNLYGAIGHCAEVAPAFIRMGNKILFQGKLPPKLRELAILWVGWLAQAPYEYTKHVAIGLETGLTQAQIDGLKAWRDCELFNEQELAVLAYTDELSRTYRVADDTFAAVRGFLDEEQVVELTVVVGFYEMVCRILEGLQVELEEDEFVPLGRAK